MEHELKFNNKQNDNVQIVFLIGRARSGKTTLGRILGSMKNVDYVEEPYALSIQVLMQQLGLIDYETTKEFLRAYVAELINDIILFRTINIRPGDLSSIWATKDAPEIFNRITNVNSRADVDAYTVENKPTIVFILSNVSASFSFLLDTFPNCKIIHIIRDKVDVAKDIVKKHWFSENSLKNFKHNYLHRQYKDYSIPWWVENGNEDIFIDAAEYDRGIYYCKRLEALGGKQRTIFSSKHSDVYKEIDFGDVKCRTLQTVTELTKFLNTESTSKTMALIEDVW